VCERSKLRTALIARAKVSARANAYWLDLADWN